MGTIHTRCIPKNRKVRITATDTGVAIVFELKDAVQEALQQQSIETATSTRGYYSGYLKAV